MPATTRDAGSSLQVTPVENSGDALDRLEAIDRAALGFSRRKHHRYMMTDGGLTGLWLWNGSQCIGYAYAGREGHVGPVATLDPAQAGEALLAALIYTSQTGAPAVSAFVPASNIHALDTALDLGLRITLPMLLMGDGEMRTWDRYMPRNPGLM